MLQDRPAASSIEQVASAIRGLRRTLRVMAATPEVLGPDQAEVLRVVASYDRWLLEAARLVELEVPVEPGDGSLLHQQRRAWLEDRLAATGWRLDA